MAVTRTSRSHPLEIAWLVVPGGGRLGFSLCPGKHEAGASGGAWARDLQADLDAIERWGAGALVSLLETGELESLRVPHLAEAAGTRGIEFHHLPIADYHAPGAAFEDLWLYAGERLRRRLAAGGGVLLHCKGGLGRSGTVAARLLVETGIDARDAMRRVRRARPGAIENAAQEAHLRELRRPPADLDRLLGCLLGGAIGDAFGYTVEFDRLEVIRERFGSAGLREPVLSNGALKVSDDTQMTLFTLEGLAAALRERPRADDDQLLARVRRAYLDWLVTQDAAFADRLPPSGGFLVNEPLLQHSRAPGNTCLSALAAGGDGSAETPLNDSKGCGGVMRVAPVGFLGKRRDTQHCAALALRAAALTHGHPSGFLAAAVMAALVRELLAGAEPDTALGRALACLEGRPDADEVRDAVDAARALLRRAPQDHGAAVTTLGEGWVAEEALAIGVYAAFSGADLREVLAIAANHDGDSDSTASLAGQLHGAWRGTAALPHEWVRRLDVLAPALRTLESFLAARDAA